MPEIPETFTLSTTRRDFLRAATIVGGAVALTGALGGPAFAAAPAANAADQAADRIVRSIKRPRIPQRDFVVTGFGAVADGVTDNTAAFAAAIAAAAAKGGGRVVVPPGD